MSNQIQITSGAKVRNLEGVLTGSSGIMSSLPINTSLGIPQLDVNGKILVDQLPNSIMEYKGSWNAATNTPTLVNGTGNAGDVYLCEVAGTVNFGAGPITFAVGDQVIYSGSIWQRASGATGTVTSVAVTESGDALTITGSPITTSGTINIGFAGTSGQYVNGAGGLTTFPSLTGFVPYTGATAALDMGNNSITTSNFIFGKAIELDAGVEEVGGRVIFRQRAATSGGGANYTTFGAQSNNNVNFSFWQDAPSGINRYKFFTFSVDNLTLNLNRTYQMPDLSGTLALLEGSQTFSGSKIFSNSAKFTSLVFVDRQINISKTPSLVAYTGGYITNYGTTSGIIYADGDTSNLSTLNFNFGGNYTYTFPAASGTIALTSNLSGYVPYTGATSNVNLGIYGLLAQAIVVGQTSTQGYIHFKTGGSTALSADTSQAPYGTNGMIYSFDQTGGNYKQFVIDSSLLTNNTIRTYSMPNASGTLALTSDLGSYVPYTGATANVNLGTFDLTADVITGATGSFASSGGSDTFAINHSSGSGIALNITKGGNGEGLYINKASGSGNAATIVGNLGGTSATFSSTLGVTGALSGTSATFSSFVQAATNFISVALTDSISVGTSSAENAKYNYLGHSGYWGIKTTTTGFNFALDTYNGGTSKNVLTITQAGAATFSSSVQVGSASTSIGGLLVIGGSSIGTANANNGQIYLGATAAYRGIISYDEGPGYLYIDNTYNNNSGNIYFRTKTSGTAINALTILGNGSVGFNTTNPLSIFQVKVATDYNIAFNTSGGIARISCYNDLSSLNASLIINGLDLRFQADGTERMRITSGGDVLIGATSIFNDGKVCISADATRVTIASKVSASTGAEHIRFINPNGVVGFISTSGTITTYSITSDYRLKQDLKDYKGLELISAIKTYDYEWKADNSRMYGVMAHELAEILPYAVSGTKDEVDEDGNDKMQGVDYSKLVPILVKSIQELEARIKDLEAK
jgi:hypothetical protein